MRRHLPMLAALFSTGACQVGEQANDNLSIAGNDNRGMPASYPRSDPMLPADDTSPQAAARRAMQYCDALAARRFGDAYALWSDDGRASGLTLSEFTDEFAGVRITDCALREPGPIQGAAGCLFIEVPAVMRGATASGRPLRIEGPIILTRVNDAPGSTVEQRRWRIARAEFPVG